MKVFIKGKEIQLEELKVVTTNGIEITLKELEMTLQDKNSKTDVPYSLALAL